MEIDDDITGKTFADITKAEFSEYLAKIEKKGEEVYLSIKDVVEERYPGKSICINVLSGDYVIALNSKTASDNFHKLYGDTASYTRRVG